MFPLTAQPAKSTRENETAPRLGYDAISFEVNNEKMLVVENT